MPAQKLTKARLAQILIMLSVLISAFFWRTFTHESVNSVDCSQKERCDVTIEGEIITINRDSMGISLETTESSTLKIDLNQSGNFINLNEKHKSVEWDIMPESKKITFKKGENIVVVQL
ncbi:hypothetical protein Q4905_004119 [Vibrio alginolyticus]|uniref:hypothetical protein n=1 Tax=Vibrio TaxID=662 RepID=UPI001BD4FCEA|nr:MULTISPECIES: hypothetical protein [Vibrio]EIF2702999.1 hypothetical protein [Vibrio alginolyticus]ELA7921757.1 hypothetical protein [Vibrio alginolyticus]ELB2769510.1 hypothetical protein [Vibrio alginolyticus]MBS9813673.1 hypothetical protein [Vibrio alginolyticus]MBT0066993.1 hypothetical protein [Vibrio alginolyticus]